MTQPDLLAALEPVVAALAQLGIAYSLVGSVASSAHGLHRGTPRREVPRIARAEPHLRDQDL